jgi:UDP-N-acetylmuramoyl-tripeptide--D-alanyl-D-alanine ligase
MRIDLHQVAVLASRDEQGSFEGSASGWSVDTRTLAAGDVFFALRGPNHDGHDHIRTAWERGAAAVVAEQGGGAGREILVPDTLAFLQSLAQWARARWGGKVIGVTGSAGKTTTKDAIAHLLGAHLRVGKNAGNLNNHVGVPLSILRLPDDAQVAVIEMGMNHAGEIRRLAEIASPDIGVVTNVGFAHVENFSSIEGVALAKRELIEALPETGAAVLNADDPRVAAFGRETKARVVTYGFSETATVRAEAYEAAESGMRFRVQGTQFATSLSGRHNAMNLLAGIAAASVLGIGPEALRDSVRSFAAGKMRGERLEHNKITVWNDCYNSNPEAARSMLDVLGATPARRRVAVLGEMLELGRSAEPLHRGIGRYAAECGIDVLIGIRGAARHMVDEARRAGLSDSAAYFFDDPLTAGEQAKKLAREGDAVLFKGSRGVQVEKALEKFLDS